MGERLVRCWYGEGSWCRLLWPLALFYGLVTGLRRRLYRQGWLKAARLPVPVIVVGNITAGGTGKTPLVLWLVDRLRGAGLRPGVISRGHGGRFSGVAPVTRDGDPVLVGDEPLLIARRADCPVWVGRRRGEAGRALLAADPGVNVLVADDGLQHHALARDMEIVLVDGERRFGNGRLIPAGPLRESPDRLDSVMAVVVNGGSRQWLVASVPVFSMRLDGGLFHNLHDPARRVAAGFFRGRKVHALAGIGNPERFFRMLAGMGVMAECHAFPDHHALRPDELPGGTVIMTEKDAVKCQGFAHADVWILPVDASIEEGLETLIMNRLRLADGQQTA